MQTNKGTEGKFIPVVLSLFLIGIITVTQLKHDDLSPPFTTKLRAVKRDLLPAKILPYTHFGFSNVLADLYWIRTIQDFVQWNKKDSFLSDYLTNISTLDPKFEYPYLFAILAIPEFKDVETLDMISVYADKGIEAIPSSWKIPYYLGTQYYLFTKKYEKPLEYLQIAAEVKDAPPGVYLTYSSFLTKNIVGDKASQELIKVIFNNTDNETIKKLASIGLQQDIISQLLEKSIAAYKARYGVYPKNVEELVQLKLITLPKELMDFFTITINKNNGSFKIEER